MSGELVERRSPLLETSRIEYFYMFQIVASENPSLGVGFKGIVYDVLGTDFEHLSE